MFDAPNPSQGIAIRSHGPRPRSERRSIGYVSARAQNMPTAARERFPANVEVFGHTLSTGTELAIVVVFACVFLALAVRGFSQAE